jgi:hypothetical protein
MRPSCRSKQLDLPQKLILQICKTPSIFANVGIKIVSKFHKNLFWKFIFLSYHLLTMWILKSFQNVCVCLCICEKDVIMYL